MKFYTFAQNNSGGSFDIDEEKGLGHYVIIEAISAEEANCKAETIGIYFDGESDCECCGNRWHPVDESAANEIPSVYGQFVFEYEDSWTIPSFIHYTNGTIIEFGRLPNL